MNDPGLLIGVLSVYIFSFLPAPVNADHSWNDYHWATTSNLVSLQVVDSVTEDWDAQLVEAISQWSLSVVLNPAITTFDDDVKTRKKCDMVEGQLHVCNAKYGKNGWLGQTVVGFDASGHIDKARSRLNENYFKFWTIENKNHVMCHELGHVFGLAHTSQDGSSQQSCMDLAYNDPLSQWPNQHDFDQLIQLYAHADSYNSVDNGSAASSNAVADNSAEPVKGKLVSRGPKHETWVAPRKDGGLWVHFILLAPEE